MKIQIIGFGIVGTNMYKIFNSADIYDPEKGYNNKSDNYDVSFVCVPTPKKNDGGCDTSIVESVIAHHNPTVFCIRSTIPPGTTKYLQEKYNKPCVFSPEYYGSTIHANALQYNFITLGGDPEYTKIVASAFKEHYTGDFEYCFTDPTIAEMAKYMENCGLALRVSFCNEIAKICNMIGVNYDQVRELWLKDKRFNPYHTIVYDDKPGWNSICFNKDIPAIIEYAKQLGVSTPIMDAVMQYKLE